MYKSVKKIGASFQPEYEILEDELRQVYDAYLERYRNLHYLENQLDLYHQQAMEKQYEANQQLKKMRQKLLKEEMKLNRGDYNAIHDNFDDDQIPEKNIKKEATFIGSMHGGSDTDDESDKSSNNSLTIAKNDLSSQEEFNDLDNSKYDDNQDEEEDEDAWF